MWLFDAWPLKIDNIKFVDVNTNRKTWIKENRLGLLKYYNYRYSFTESIDVGFLKSIFLKSEIL